MQNAKLHPDLAKLVVTSYEGERDDCGRMVGEGVARFVGGHSYTGCFLDGMMHGLGAYSWCDGTRFCGTFSRNTMSGSGRYEWPDGSCYEGSISLGLRHGQGTLCGSAKDGGMRYRGEWKEGRRHGRGELRYDPEGLCAYDGEWCEDERQGFGTMRYASGNTYCGEWAHDLKSGTGEMVWRDVGERYKGGWLDDAQSGRGEHVWLDKAALDCAWAGSPRHMCNRYTGDWLAGCRHGSGTFVYANGARYAGEWSKGAKQGQGAFVHEDGAIYAGAFYEDRAVSEHRDETQKMRPCVRLHLGDLGVAEKTGTEGADARELARLQKAVLRFNSELKHVYDAYAALCDCDDDANNGKNLREKAVFCLSVQQLRLFAKDCRLCPDALSFAHVDHILLQMRRQALHVMASAEGGIFSHSIEADARPSRLAVQPLSAHASARPVLYREFLEFIVRVAVAVAAGKAPELTPTAALTALVTNYVRPRGKLDAPSRTRLRCIDEETVDARVALALAMRALEDSSPQPAARAKDYSPETNAECCESQSAESELDTTLEQALHALTATLTADAEKDQIELVAQLSATALVAPELEAFLRRLLPAENFDRAATALADDSRTPEFLQEDKFVHKRLVGRLTNLDRSNPKSATHNAASAASVAVNAA